MPGPDASLRLLVTLDGRRVALDAPLLRGDDLGVVRGDGVFEALLVVDGVPELLEDHLARLERSAGMVDIVAPPREAWRRAVAVAADAWAGGPEMVARLVLTRGPVGTGEPTGYLLCDPLDPSYRRQRDDGISVLTLERGLDPALAERAPWLLMGAKTLSYAVNMAAQRWAAAHGADDVIFTAAGGTVLEAPTSGVVIARGRRLLSPPVSLGILPSISVRDVFDAATGAGWEATYASVTVDDLRSADAVWLTSTVRLVTRVHTLDGTALPDAGLTKEIAALLGLGWTG
jgi:4-amino-4-deoxychorismate lyase